VLKRRSLLVGLTVGALALVLAPTASAQSTALEASASAAKTKVCVTMIERIEPGKPETRIVSQRCDENVLKGQESAAESSLLQAPDAEGRAAAASSTLLVRFYQHIGYGGIYDSVYGSFGPCDYDGYGMSDTSVIQANVGGISSYRIYNQCNVTEMNTRTHWQGLYSGLRYWDQSYIQPTWNDHVNSFWAQKG
jgi:hypothetical protein